MMFAFLAEKSEWQAKLELKDKEYTERVDDLGKFRSDLVLKNSDCTSLNALLLQLYVEILSSEVSFTVAFR